MQLTLSHFIGFSALACRNCVLAFRNNTTFTVKNIRNTHIFYLISKNLPVTADILNEIVTNQIQRFALTNSSYGREVFIPGTQHWFNAHQSVNAVHKTDKRKDQKHSESGTSRARSPEHTPPSSHVLKRGGRPGGHCRKVRVGGKLDFGVRLSLDDASVSHGFHGSGRPTDLTMRFRPVWFSPADLRRSHS